ncbi:uncharacterized protein LOC106393513 [Brassica napus]|uniref:uncharacterized protein LOC106393513 n=1 Tax=Brassica napus TaxID=3708 RepID=UPI0006AB2CBD|nr:uncharacterized protein LOC106393513 [Brassica napus]
MAHSSSSSNVVYKNEKGVVCNCNCLANVVQAWTDDNPGRRFYSCEKRKTGDEYDCCNFFQWYDVEKPHGWQRDALIGARNVNRQQREEIKSLRNKIRALRENMGPNSTDLKEKTEACDACEGLKREVLILNERSRVYRNVLITSSVGFTVVLGVFIGVLKW